MRLTDTTIKGIAESAEERVFWDDRLPGFGLRVRPSGTRTFIVQYRVGGGRRSPSRKLTIGRYGAPWTIEKAREEAKRILSEASLGQDPAADKMARREALTVSELCDLYFDQGCTTKKPSTIGIDRNRVARHVKPLLGTLRVPDVTKADIQRFLADVAAGATATDVKTGVRGRAIVRGGKGAATRTVGLLGAIFTFAVERKMRADNPVHGVKRYADKKGERHLSSEEWARLGAALASVQADGFNPVGVAMIRLLALTGCRKSEVAGLEWSEVDLERSRLTLADSKSGAKVVPIGAPARQLLADLDREEDQRFVFPGERFDGPFGGMERIWREVRKRAGLEDLRLHDLRHSYASRGLLSGAGLPVIGAILGHKDVKTTGRYAHLADDPVKRAADRIANDVNSALAGTGVKRNRRVS